MYRHLVWILDKEETRKILADVERFKTRLVIALQRDNMKISRAIKEEAFSTWSLRKFKRGRKFAASCDNFARPFGAFLTSLRYLK